jgi:hypothetical protein
VFHGICLLFSGRVGLIKECSWLQGKGNTSASQSWDMFPSVLDSNASKCVMLHSDPTCHFQIVFGSGPFKPKSHTSPPTTCRKVWPHPSPGNVTELFGGSDVPLSISDRPDLGEPYIHLSPGGPSLKNAVAPKL